MCVCGLFCGCWCGCVVCGLSEPIVARLSATRRRARSEANRNCLRGARVLRAAFYASRECYVFCYVISDIAFDEYSILLDVTNIILAGAAGQYMHALV